MDRAPQLAIANAFQARHRSGHVLVLPNVWDALSARLFVEAGFDALATTSGGVAWALGYPDGEIAPWSEVVAATALIVRVAGVPVTADIEAGYGATPAEVGAHVAEIIQTGVVGINLEDGLHGPIRDTDDAATRIAAAREAANAEGVPIVINARCDALLQRRGDDRTRLQSTIARCKTYLAAGADCVYPFGLRDPAAIAAFVKSVDAPVNIMGRPGLPDAASLGRMGVARITLGTAPTLVAMAAIQQLATDLYAQAGFESLGTALQYPDVQAFFQRKE